MAVPSRPWSATSPPSAPAAPRPRSWSASRSSTTARSTPLNQLASISVPEPHQIVIQPWDRGVLGAIEKAIQKSDIGLMPNVDGTVVRLNIPPLTEERRSDLVKVVHKRMEEARVEIRNHRRDGPDDLRKQEKDGEHRRRRGAPRAGAHREADPPLDRRGRPRRQGQGAGDHGGLGDRAPSAGHTEHRTTAAGRRSGDGRRSPATSRSSWTATAAGRASGACPRRRATPRASRPSGPSWSAPSAAGRRGALDLRLQPRELGARQRRGRDALRACSTPPSATRPRDLVRAGRRASGCWVALDELPRADPCVHRGGARGDRGRHAHDPQRRVQLLRPDRDRGRRPALHPGRHARPTTSTRRPSPRGCTRRTCRTSDLLIRTGGDQRISNFLLWQAAYAELYFCDRYWPDFDPTEFDAALAEYARRSRRFGR